MAYEEEGTFAATLTAEGYEQVERSYEVAMDAQGCHVEGVTDTIALGREE